MPLNHYVTLGRSGLRVSPFCLGAMTFGEDLGWGSSAEMSNAIMDRFLERGGNFIDTANAYTRGHSEKIIGDHLGRHPSKRDRVVLATKFFGSLFPDDPNGGGAGRKAMIAQCEESLRRLQTDYIDLYWMHCWDMHTPIEETLRGLDDLVRSGKVRYVGVSDTPAWKVAQAQVTAHFRGWMPLAALQIEYSLLERNEKTYGIIDVLQRVAKELDTTVARVALAWVQGRPGVTSTIIGARTLEQLDNNLGALDVQLEPEHVKALDDVSTPTLDFPAGFLQGAPTFMHGGLTVNGVAAPAWPMAPKSGKERW